MCGPKHQAWNPSPGTPTLPSGKLASASSYKMLTDMAKGKHLVNPRYAGAESLKYGLWLSQLIAINYNGPQNIGDTSLGYRNSLGLNQAVAVQGLFICPGYVIDPNESVLAPPICVQPAVARGSNWWARLAIPTHQDQPGYWKAVNAQPLNGIGTEGSFANNVTFSDDLVNGNTEIQQAFGPHMSARSSGKYNCLSENGPLELESVHSVQEIKWHKVGGAFSTGSGIDAQAHRVPGFIPRCARHQGCIGFEKLN